ncbi:MAG: zinc ABC transporter substrate-binding protein [Firmicutes bacterium]|nr:zinc ABC transporter substrate-binding protein [Bacillota bacterium]
MIRSKMRKMSRKVVVGILVAFLGMLILTSCGETSDESNNKLKVAVTIEVEKAFVEGVAGDLVDVVTLVPKGGSPETFEASPKEIEEFKDADIFFSMELPVENSKNIPTDGDFKTIDLAEAVREKYEDRYFAPGSRDHHIWLSPKRVVLMVEQIAMTLIEQDPANKEIYLKNKEDYIKKIENLDIEINTMLKDKTQKTFLIYHPALGYFADDYGLEMLPFEEEGKEADAKHIGELIDLAKIKNIKGIITTEEISSKQVDAFAEEIGGKVIVVEVLSKDYISAMENIADQIGRLLR